MDPLSVFHKYILDESWHGNTVKKKKTADQTTAQLNVHIFVFIRIFVYPVF